MSVINEEKTVLAGAEVERLERSYGLKFVPLPNGAIAELDECIDSMVRARSYSSSSRDLDLAGEEGATLYLPELVLQTTLDTAQVRAINTSETEAVAKFSTNIQRELLKVPIRDTFEEMQHIPTLVEDGDFIATFSSKPFHEACGLWAGRERQFWVRAKLADRLVVMGQMLNAAGVQLCFEDAFRPLGVQEGLFKRRIAWTRRDYPNWSEDRIIEEAKSKTAAIARLASHKGGAAVDATIKTLSGNDLSFGHKYPDGGALVFPRTPFITADQWKNRQLFQVAAGLSGLTLYVGEDWHVSYGDNLAALNSMGIVDPLYTAQYGPIKGFSREGGRGIITEVYSEQEMDQIFPMN